ncbi:GSCOCG00007641001-RA-CDS [Cotesia congregata]|nr:GSCOCG00007641001-RA-CDS [Cotesia congregata]
MNSMVAFSRSGSTLGAISKSPFSWSQVWTDSSLGNLSGILIGVTFIRCFIFQSNVHISGVFLTIAISLATLSNLS